MLNSGQNWQFFVLCPWNLMDDLEKKMVHLFYAASSFVHHFIAISEFKLRVWKRPIWVKINDFFIPCDLEIWQMTWKNNRAPLLCYIKFCTSFLSHWWIQTEVTIWKYPIWVKIDDFFSRVTLKFDRWPWKTIGHSPKQHQALCIISSPYVNLNWSYRPETAK